MHAAFRSLRSGRTAGSRGIRDRGGLLIALTLLLGFGVAFANGGYTPTSAGVSVVGAVVLAIAVGALVAGGAGRMVPGGDVARGVALLGLFAAWAIASVAWSVRPDRSLAWGVLVAGYAAVVLVATASARVSPRARGATLLLLLLGTIALAGVSVVERLGGDAAVAVLGGIDNARRLSGPLDYWNALGLVSAIGILIAARLAVDALRRPAVRAGFGAVVPPLAGVVLLSQSRGALLALLVGVVVVAAATRSARLRLPAFVVGAFAAGAPMAVAGAGRVSGEGIVTAHGTAAVLGAIVLALVLGAAGALVLSRVETRIPWTGERTTRLVRVTLALLAVAVVGAFVVGSATQGGPGEALSSVTDKVASTDEVAPVQGADRLLSTSSSNRTEWWAEAFGAWAERPVEGWGASSFVTSRERFRTDTTDVAQPHSLPLQVLAETGLVGFVLLGAALWLLLRAATRRLRELPPGLERTLQGLLLGVVAAWLAQSLVDWDFDLPGVTIPVLVALGVAAGAPGRRDPAVSSAADLTYTDISGTGPIPIVAAGAAPASVAPAAIPDLAPRMRLGGRSTLLAGLLVAGILVSIATVAPLIADRSTDRALAVLSGDVDAARLESATQDAAFAAGLDPFGLAPLEAGRLVNVRRENLLEARRLALRETERQPDAAQSWLAVGEVASDLADRAGLRAAATVAIRLDPQGAQANALLGEANAQQAPPAASPTATGTPLPATRAQARRAQREAGGTAAAPATGAAAPGGAGATSTPAPAPGASSASTTASPTPSPRSGTGSANQP